jgi:hypothetical protein
VSGERLPASAFWIAGIQLPSQRAGYRLICSSTEFQARREAQAVGLGRFERYVRQLLEQRASDGAELEARRKRREARWAAVRDGLIAPMSVEEVTALYPVTSDEVGGGGIARRQRMAKGAEAAAAGRLIDAVDARARELGGGVTP